MKKIKKEILGTIFFILILIFSSISILAINYFQIQEPNVLSYYSREGIDYRSFWPNLENKELCEARQDFIINIRPGSCTPAVVRSDLLAEQDVPVFCKLDAIKINPFIKVMDIKSVRISGEYPKEISGIGFYPSRAAVRMYSTKIDNPLITDIGYVVVKLRKTPEREMKDYVQANLTAIIRYDVEKAFGVGDSVFYLPLLDENEWKNNYIYYGFWDGKAYLRLNDINDENAEIYVYTDKEHIWRKINLKKGQTSSMIYLPGSYCMAGVQLKLDEILSPTKRALLEIDGVREWVSEGEYFLDKKCRINNIIIKVGEKIVNVVCGGNKYVLSFGLPNKINLEINKEIKEVSLGENVGNNTYFVYNGLWEGKNREEFIVLSKVTKSDLIENGKIKKEALDEINSKIISIKDNKNFSDYVNKVISLISSNLRINREDVYVLEKEKEEKINNFEYKFIESLVLVDEKQSQEIEEIFEKAKETTNKIVNYYGVSDISKESLKILARLSESLGKIKTEYETIEKLLNYLNESEKEEWQRKLEQLAIYDYTKSSTYVKIGDDIHTLTLIDAIEPKKEEANAEFYVEEDKKGFSKEVGVNEYLYDKDDISLKLKSLYNDRVVLEYVYYDKEGRKHTEEVNIKVGEKEMIRKEQNNYIEVNLLKVNLKKIAKVSIIANVPQAESAVNFTFKIGIEKRAIKLSPEKTQEMINNLNESIKKWEKITNNLGQTVKAWKGACLATSTVLTIKNFFENMGGKATARKMIMQGPGGWDEKCEGLVNERKYKNMNECFSKNSDAIEKAVNKLNEEVKKINEEIEKATVVEKQDIFGSVIDEMKTTSNFAFSFKKFVQENKELEISVGKENKKLGDLFTEEKIDMMIKSGMITVEDMRDIMLYGRLINDPDLKELATKRFENNVRSLYERTNEPLVAKSLEDSLSSSLGGNIIVSITGNVKAIQVKEVYKIKNNLPEGNYVFIVTSDYPGVLLIPVEYISGTYYKYNGKEIYGTKNGKDFEKVENIANKIQDFVFYEQKGKCENKYSNPEVRFFDDEPYKGLPQLIPLDTNRGWYVAFKRSVSNFGSSSPYTQAGMPSVFWLCNVGENGLEEFYKYNSDDMCTRIDILSRQPIDEIYCLSESEAREMIRRAINIVGRVSSQYGNKIINVPGVGNFPGKASKEIDERQCQDFMSAKDCNILFNVCDPVVCPSSRCDLGGRYRVDDVIQSGIFGSLVLCLPNFGNPSEGGVIVPVCLTGLYAGLDNYISVLKAHRDCLQESLESGNYVGICDELYSIYLCEFFWRQAAPLLRVGIPKLIEYVYYGSKMRGGGEYALINDAWTNMENSFNYFTTYYAKNIFNVFQKRSSADVGTEFCKAFISATYPTSRNILDQLLEPESPVQFYARFDEIPFSDVTVPPTSHYKVYYHIYAGRDEGAYYSVYLKRSEETIAMYGLQQPTIVVDTGYIRIGEAVDKTKDFTAPAGYKELCVRINTKEYCGFGQVTTDFAINYFRDKYVESEATRKINSEEECISGSFNIYGIVNPNLQEGIQQAMHGSQQIGIVRVCSTHPPDGIIGNESRWKAVGYCDKDRGIICWLDTESIKEAVQGIGIENKTLIEIEKIAKNFSEEIYKRSGVLSESEAETTLKELENEKEKIINLIENKKDFDLENFEKKVDKFVDEVIWNDYKARALLFKLEIYDKLCRKKLEEKSETFRIEEEIKENKSLETQLSEIKNESKEEQSKIEENKTEEIKDKEVETLQENKTEEIKNESKEITEETSMVESSRNLTLIERMKRLFGLYNKDFEKYFNSIEQKDKNYKLDASRIKVGKEVIKIVNNIQTDLEKKYRVKDLDRDINSYTNGEVKNFECLILMIAMQESSLYHCNPQKEEYKADPLYCSKTNKLEDFRISSSSSGDISLGIMQINIKVHPSQKALPFEENVKYGTELIVKNFANKECKEDWIKAVSSYNLGHCPSSATSYARKVFSYRDLISNNFPECRI